MQILNENKSVELTIGTLNINGLQLSNWAAALELYANFVQIVGVLTEYTEEDDITNEVIQEAMPLIWADIYVTQPTILFNFLEFVSDITEEQFKILSLEDLTSMWEVVYEVNRRPFVSTRVRLKKLGIFKLLMNVDAEKLLSFLPSLKSESELQI